MTHRYQLSGPHIAYYRDHPEVMARQQFGFEPDADQTRLLRSAIVEGKHVSWRSGTGPGKTAAFAILVLEWLYLFPDARVVATSTKKEQITDVLWPEILKWISRSKLKDDYQWNAESVHLVGREKQVFAVARTGNSPEAMQGFHADYLLIVCDEASGIEDLVFQPLEGTLTGKHNVLVLGGNPTRAGGYFFDSHHKDRDQYVTMHTSSEGHPRVDQVKLVARMASKWGRDSDMFRTRVLGEFPKGDPSAMISLELAMSAVGREGVESEGYMEVGVDVARDGDDRSVMIGRRGMKFAPEFRVRGKLKVPETAGEVIAYCRWLRQHFNYFGMSITVKVDDTGVGGGVTDLLQLQAEAEDLVIVPCNFGGTGTDEYDGWATWAWAQAADTLLKCSLPQPKDCPHVDDLIGELTTRRKSMTPKGAIKLEAKRDYKKRQRFSPDLADAFVLCCAAEWQGSDALPMMAPGPLAYFDLTSDLTPSEQAEAAGDNAPMTAPMDHGVSDLPNW